MEEARCPPLAQNSWLDSTAIAPPFTTRTATKIDEFERNEEIEDIEVSSGGEEPVEEDRFEMGDRVKHPSVFFGRPDEDPAHWIDRFEEISAFNGCNAKAQLSNHETLFGGNSQKMAIVPKLNNLVRVCGNIPAYVSLATFSTAGRGTVEDSPSRGR